MKKENFSCNFCGKDRSLVKKLISGPGVYICNECINLSYEIITQAPAINISEIQGSDLITPQELKHALDDFVVGQDTVKEILSTSAVNHIKRMLINDPSQGVEIHKSNMLILGSTGTGKTLLAKTLAKILEVPIAITDATSLTESGYVGEDVDSVLERLLTSADYDLELAQQGIIFIDEIDKKASKTSGGHSLRDVSGEGVQQALLKLIEGSVVKVKTENRRGYEETVEFDTTDILFIFSGAFVGVEKIIERRLNTGTGMGFSAKLHDQTLHKNTEILKKITVKDLTDYGIIPELLGRVPVIAVMDALESHDYLQILRDVKNSIVEQYEKLALLDKIGLTFTDDFLLEVAARTQDFNLGGRALRSLMDNATLNIFYRLSQLEKTGVVHITFTKYLEAPTFTYEGGAEKIDTEYTIYRGSNVK